MPCAPQARKVPSTGGGQQPGAQAELAASSQAEQRDRDRDPPKRRQLLSTEAAQAHHNPTPPARNPACPQAQLAQLPRTAASTRLLKQLADFNQRGKDGALPRGCRY